MSEEKTDAPKAAPEAPAASNASVTKKSNNPLMVIVLVIAGLLLVGGGVYLATNSDDEVTLTTYTAETDPQFKVDYPDDWEVDEAFGSYEFIENADNGGAFRASMDVEVVDFTDFGISYTPDELFDEFLGSLNSELESQDPSDEDYGTNLRDERTTINGYEAMVVSIDFDNIAGEDGEKGSGKAVVLFLSPTSIATITMEGHESDERFLEVFDDIMNSFMLV